MISLFYNLAIYDFLFIYSFIFIMARLNKEI